MHDLLAEIVENKRREVEAAKKRLSFAELEAMVAQQEPARNFFSAVTKHPDAFHTSVIAEVKRKSPSGGYMRPEFAEDAPDPPHPPRSHHPPAPGPDNPGNGDRPRGFDPAWVAQRYYANGAAAISCLTDETYFGGSLHHLERIRERVPLPVLRKDFIIDEWQLWESRAFGADAVLLIAECLGLAELLDMLILAQRLGLTTLLEAHSTENLLRVRPHVGFPHPAYALLGINNRDLATQKVDLNHTLRLVDMVDDPTILVSESGIRTRADIVNLRHQKVRIVLVGEHLIRADDPGAALADLLGRTPR